MNNQKSREKPRLVFIANSMYGSTVSGGDVHTLSLAKEAIRAGYGLHFFCGHALKAEIERRKIPVTMSVTDGRMLPSYDFTSLPGQFRLLADYIRRLRGSLRQLHAIQPNDLVYCTTEFWWDFVPGYRSVANRKILYIGMDSPSLKQVVLASRPDVKAVRLPSLHYWMAQEYALKSFLSVPRKRLIYAHENMETRLGQMGYSSDELLYVGNGVDLERALAVPEQPRIYDVAWVGRPHKQKGIDDLLSSLGFLVSKLPDLRVILIGNLEPILGPKIAAMGISKNVAFSGYVSERRKFELLKSSRVFLMPSRYESWGIVIGEALASGLGVVAYDLDAYRPVFGDLVEYVSCFDAEAFAHASLQTVLKGRQPGGCSPDKTKLAVFIRHNSWEVVGRRFLSAVGSLLNDRADAQASSRRNR